MPRLVITTSCVALALAVGACGGGAALSGDARAAVETVHAFHRHLARGEVRKACALLTGVARAEIAGDAGDCELTLSLMGAMFSKDEARGLADIVVRRVRVRGTRAFIDDRDVRFPASIAYLQEAPNGRPTVLVRAGARWRIEELG